MSPQCVYASIMPSPYSSLLQINLGLITLESELLSKPLLLSAVINRPTPVTSFTGKLQLISNVLGFSGSSKTSVVECQLSLPISLKRLSPCLIIPGTTDAKYLNIHESVFLNTISRIAAEVNENLQQMQADKLKQPSMLNFISSIDSGGQPVFHDIMQEDSYTLSFTSERYVPQLVDELHSRAETHGTVKRIIKSQGFVKMSYSGKINENTKMEKKNRNEVANKPKPICNELHSLQSIISELMDHIRVQWDRFSTKLAATLEPDERQSMFRLL